jgi:hypothetical protein
MAMTMLISIPMATQTTITTNSQVLSLRDFTDHWPESIEWSISAIDAQTSIAAFFDEKSNSRLSFCETGHCQVSLRSVAQQSWS